jgi:hypothetical protein
MDGCPLDPQLAMTDLTNPHMVGNADASTPVRHRLPHARKCCGSRRYRARRVDAMAVYGSDYG